MTLDAVDTTKASQTGSKTVKNPSHAGSDVADLAFSGTPASSSSTKSSDDQASYRINPATSVDATLATPTTSDTSSTSSAPAAPATSPHALRALLATQVCFYLIFGLLSLSTALFGENSPSAFFFGRYWRIPSFVEYDAVVLMLLILFYMFCPFVITLSEGIVAAVSGFVALAISCIITTGHFFMLVLSSPAGLTPYARWLETSVVLLIVLIIVAFAMQMARKKRSQLVLSISRTLTISVACICASGWCLLGSVIRDVLQLAASPSQPMTFFISLSAVSFLLMVVLLAAASCQWWFQIQGQIDWIVGGIPWLGMGLLPVMFAGLLPGFVGLAMSVMFA